MLPEYLNYRMLETTTTIRTIQQQRLPLVTIKTKTKTQHHGTCY